MAADQGYVPVDVAPTSPPSPTGAGSSRWLVLQEGAEAEAQTPPAPHPRRVTWPRLKIALAGLVGLLGVVAARAVLAGTFGAKRTSVSARQQVLLGAAALVGSQPSCGSPVDGVEYETHFSLYQRSPIMSAEDCEARCRGEPQCSVWMWGAARNKVGLTDVCFLRGLGSGERPQRYMRPGVTSGVLCRADYLKNGGGSGFASNEGIQPRRPFPGDGGPTGRVQDPSAPNGVSRAPAPARPTIPPNDPAATVGAAGAARQNAIACGSVYPGMELLTQKSLYKVFPIPNPEMCRVRCEDIQRCAVWTWGKTEGVLGLDNVCFLKELGPGERPEVHVNPNRHSGVACRSAPAPAPPPAQPLPPTTTVPTSSPKPLPPTVTTTTAATVIITAAPTTATSTTTVSSTTTLPPTTSTPPPTTTSAAPTTTSAVPTTSTTVHRTIVQAPQCGTVWSGALLNTTSTLVELGHIRDHIQCASYCKSNLQCKVWSWTSGKCVLQELQPAETIQREDRAGYVSGVTCHTDSDRSTTTRPAASAGIEQGVPVELLKVGVRVQVLSPVKVKRDCSVIAVEKGRVQVHYDGFASAHDEWLPTNSDRLLTIIKQADDSDAVSTSTTESTTTPVLTAAPTTAAPSTTMAPVTQTRCPPPWHETDLQTSSALSQVVAVPSFAECMEKCRQEEKCGAWSWGEARNSPGLTDVCFLKAMQPGEEPQRIPKAGVISGKMCRGPPVHQFPDHFPQGSLFCFALMQPVGYEKGLIAMQYAAKSSLFACEEYAVYSSSVLEVAPGLFTGVVNSDLKCDYGGEFKTALNTDIFFAVWDKVFADGRYTFHDWTVKVDPDAVFLPQRLHARLAGQVVPPQGLYVNNCKMGMHGPLEVFSRQAVEAWRAGRQHCVTHFTRLCSGPCLWGEDMFIDQCMKRVLNVERHNDYELLVEDHCDPPDGWDNCADPSFVAFHPFKTEDGYRGCLAATVAAEGAAPARVATDDGSLRAAEGQPKHLTG